MVRLPRHNKMLWSICLSNFLSKCNHFGPFWPFWAILTILGHSHWFNECFYSSCVFENLWNRVVPHFITNHQWLTCFDAILFQLKIATGCLFSDLIFIFKYDMTQKGLSCQIFWGKKYMIWNILTCIRVTSSCFCMWY